MSISNIVYIGNYYWCDKCNSYCSVKGDMVICDNENCNNKMSLSHGELKEYEYQRSNECELF